jgi:hypothetical protein
LNTRVALGTGLAAERTHVRVARLAVAVADSDTLEHVEVAVRQDRIRLAYRRAVRQRGDVGDGGLRVERATGIALRTGVTLWPLCTLGALHVPAID